MTKINDNSRTFQLWACPSLIEMCQIGKSVKEHGYDVSIQHLESNNGLFPALGFSLPAFRWGRLYGLSPRMFAEWREVQVPDHLVNQMLRDFLPWPVPDRSADWLREAMLAVYRELPASERQSKPLAHWKLYDQDQ